MEGIDIVNREILGELPDEEPAGKMRTAVP
jgi:hypothetical protein